MGVFLRFYWRFSLLFCVVCLDELFYWACDHLKSFPERAYRSQDGKEGSLQAAGETSSCVRGAWLVSPIPPTHGITFKPCHGWQQARAHLNTTLSCLSAGIREGSGLPRERTKSHRHKPACKKFLLVRKIQCDNAQMWEQGIQKDCRISLALGRWKTGMGWDLSKLGCLHQLSEDWIKYWLSRSREIPNWQF